MWEASARHFGRCLRGWGGAWEDSWICMHSGIQIHSVARIPRILGSRFMDFHVLWDPDSMIHKKFTDSRIQILDAFGFWYPELMILMHLMDSGIWMSRFFQSLGSDSWIVMHDMEFGIQIHGSSWISWMLILESCIIMDFICSGIQIHRLYGF